MVVLAGGGIIAGVAMVLLVAGGLTRAKISAPEKSPATRELYAFEHGPAASTPVTQAWNLQDKAVHDHLTNYAWVDRGAGVVQIPLERAMELIAQESAANPPQSNPVSR